MTYEEELEYLEWSDQVNQRWSYEMELRHFNCEGCGFYEQTTAQEAEKLGWNLFKEVLCPTCAEPHILRRAA